MAVDRLEDIPGYLGIVGEVSTFDCYELKKLDFVPDLIFDIGANVGAFARHAHELFPSAQIVCVEPDPDNFENLCKFTNGPCFTFINLPIGKGKIWRHVNTPSIGHRCYMSAGLGFPEDRIGSVENSAVVLTEASPITLVDLANRFPLDSKNVFLKMDVEGNEHTVFTDPESMAVLRKCRAFSIEVHRYAITGDLINEVRQKTGEALDSFKDKFDVHWGHAVFHARRKA